jgi:hypothetical protein
MDLERAKAIFDDIKDLKIELIRDPASLGPDYLRESIALCRNHLNKVSYYLQEVMEEAHLMNLHLDGLEAQFQIESDELLANDNRVKHLPNVADRMAMINVILGEQTREIKRVKREITNLKHVDKVVRHRKGELDNTMSTLRLQASLLRDQLRSGLSYGDDFDSKEEDRRRAVQGDDINLDDILDESVAELEGEDALVQNVEAPPSEQEAPPVAEAKVVVPPAPEPVKSPEKSAEDDFSLFEDTPDVDELAASAARTKKTKKREKTADVPSQKSADDFSDLEDLIASGGVDATPAPKPVKEETKSPAPELETDPLPLKSGDVDTDMQRFLDEDPGDALDALLADI